MTISRSGLLALAVASAATLGSAAAQPDVRDHREPKEHRHDGRDDRRPPPPPTAEGGPREAPPAPRAETNAPRAGFVWIPGRWDWKGGKWEWRDGHWERERAGKKWREGRWERKGDAWGYVEGEWTAGDAAAPPPPGPPPGGSPPIVPDDRRPDERRPRREWKLERPVVSSYWPARGKEGARIVIRGRNFPADATIVWAGAPVRAARVTPEQIVFQVPPGAASSEIAIRTGRGRDLAVGTFEVAAAYDAEAEAKKLEEERRRKAEAEWAERQKQLAKDRAAREAAWRQREQEREANREQRRAERAAALRARWDRAFLADPETQDELTLHAQRIAELERMREVAELASNGKLVVRVQIAQGREDERHDQRMAALKAAFGTKGGAP